MKKNLSRNCHSKSSHLLYIAGVKPFVACFKSWNFKHELLPFIIFRQNVSQVFHVMRRQVSYLCITCNELRILLKLGRRRMVSILHFDQLLRSSIFDWSTTRFILRRISQLEFVRFNSIPRTASIGISSLCLFWFLTITHNCFSIRRDVFILRNTAHLILLILSCL